MGFNNKIIIVIIAAIALYAVFLLMSDITALSKQVIKFRFQYLPIILILVPSSWIPLFIRWRFLLGNSGIQVPWKENLKIFLAGNALAITPGKVGDLVKSQLLKSKFDIQRTRTAPIVLVEKVYDLVGAVAASLFGVWLLGIGAYIILVASSILVIAFVLISSSSMFKKVLGLLSKFKFASKILLPLSESYEVVRSSCRGKVATVASLLTVCYWMMESLAVYFVLVAFGVDTLNYFNVVSTYTTSLILGAASFVPGGIGVAEGSLVGLLSLQGVKISSAFTPVVIIRLSTLWYAVGVGFLALKLTGGISVSEK
ncbi:MAG: hypothetical protein AUH84_01635 [Thaumarchaeota archaeon 13_1_40CM_4_38_7]|nr:MAG: hypothetical protein AUH84_01635 [Thaumarchaeota archaeon 13_1_40CM_4_38_7]OLC92732.1 MAG: hypothetical protein AUI92_04455 [Thaumarchaeota archaeon 13_1_40CM_3_38_6]